MFQLIVLLKFDFNCWSSFALSWVNKVTTEAWSFALVIASVLASIEFVITQADDHAKMELISVD